MGNYLDDIRTLHKVFAKATDARWAADFKVFTADMNRHKINMIRILVSDLEEVRLLIEKYYIYRSTFRFWVLSDHVKLEKDDWNKFFNRNQGFGAAKSIAGLQEEWGYVKLLVLETRYSILPTLYASSLGMYVVSGNTQPLGSHQIILSAILNNFSLMIENSWTAEEYDIYMVGPIWDGTNDLELMKFLQDKANQGKEVIVNSPSIWLETHPRVHFENKELILSSKVHPHSDPAYTFKVKPNGKSSN